MKPPYDTNAEQSVLGGLLRDSTLLLDVRAILESEDFYKGAHRHIFEAILDLDELDEPVDLITVSDRLRKKGVIDLAGGSAYVSALPDFIPTTENITTYARLVRDKAVRRRLGLGARELAHMAADENIDLDELLNNTQRIVEGLENRQDDMVQTAAEVAAELEADLRAHRERNEMRGFITGVSTLDRAFWFKRTDFNVIAGRPTAGKTHLGNMIARELAQNDGPVLQVNLEVPHTDNLEKQAKAFAVFDARGFQHPAAVNDNDFERMIYAVRTAGKLPIYFTKVGSADMILRLARTYAARGIKHVVTDYLQIVDFPDSYGRGEYQQISSFTRKVKKFALNHNVCMWALAQLKRAPDAKTERRPTMADLKGSGSIEQDADNIILIHRPNPKKRDDGSWAVPPDLVEWIFAKGRHKQDRYAIRMRRDFDRGAFVEWEDRDDEEDLERQQELPT